MPNLLKNIQLEILTVDEIRKRTTLTLGFVKLSSVMGLFSLVSNMVL